MALTYTGSTGIFTNLGSVIARVIECGEDIEDWESKLDLIQDSFEPAEMQAAEAPLIGYVQEIQQSLGNTRASLSNLCVLRLQDFTTVVQPLGIPSDDIGSILYALISQMVLDTASVNASTVTIGSVTAASGNTGNGTVIVDGTLDGYSIHVGNGIAHPAYLGRLTELAVSETMTFRVTSDSYADGLTSGEETLSWNGQPALNGTWEPGEEGSGDGPSLTTLQAGSILSNMDFEAWSVTNTPDNWTMVGTVTTHYARESSVIYRGTYALKMIGDGAQATISASQAVAITSIKPLQRYCVSIRYRISTTDTASQTFSVKFTGTGYTEGATEKITVLGNVMPTSYTLGYFFVNIPAVIPSDFALKISWAGTPNSGKTVYVDDVGFAPVDWHNGLCAVAIAGSTPFVKGDSWTTAIVNDQTGLIQEFFRRGFGIQLPSLTTSAETISDGLVV